MKKIVIVLLCFISIVLVGCEKKANSSFKTEVDDKYLLVDYEKKMAEYDFGREISVNTVSICSTKKNEDGIIVTDGKGADEFFEEYSDIFKHPFIEGNGFVNSKDSIFVIISSSKFDPKHFAYADIKYNDKQKALYLIFSRADSHTILLNPDTQSELITNVEKKSKATYTILEFKKKELKKINKVYFSVPNDF